MENMKGKMANVVGNMMLTPLHNTHYLASMYHS